MPKSCNGGAGARLLVSLLASLTHLTLPLLIAAWLSAAVSLVAAPPRPPRANPPEDPRKPYALIFGTVWGPNNYPVYGVKVRIRRTYEKKAKWEVYSNHAGEFAQRVPAGKADYVVWVETKDLKGLKSSDGNQLEGGTEVTVSIANDERQDIGLHLK